MEVAAPLQLQRRPRFKIGRIGLRGGAILALTVNQECFGGPETRIRAGKGSGLARYPRIKGSLLLNIKDSGRLSSEIDFSGSCSAAISALTVDQECLGTGWRSRNLNTRGEKFCLC